MIISKKQQLTATLSDIDLKCVEKYEYLGVVLNNNMNYGLIENQPSHLPSKETQTHGFHGKQARLRLQKLDPEASTSTAHPC